MIPFNPAGVFLPPMSEKNFYLEWDIIGNEGEPLISTHQRHEFGNRKEFDSYRSTILEAQEHGMCKNVAWGYREIAVGPWTEGDPQ